MDSQIAKRILAFNSDRLPFYAQLKYGMMTQSPFRFFRGTCHLFYEDLAAANPFSQSPAAWICGDLHLENFGSFKGDNRLVYFDLNDFDEAVLAPVTWEVARMVTSIFVGLSTLQLPSKEIHQISALFLRVYSDQLAKGKARYIERLIAKGIVRQFLAQVEERKFKTILQNRTEKSGKNFRLRIDKRRFYPIEKKLKEELQHFFVKWLKDTSSTLSQYKFQDVAFRVAGTGSMGVQRFVFLVRHKENLKKYLLIDMKQAKPSSLTLRATSPQPNWLDEAHRVVSIQQRMQNIPPAMLTPVRFNDEPFVLKELQPTDDKIDFLIIKDNQKYLKRVIEDMALLTASAQLRSSGRQGAAVADDLITFGLDSHWQGPLLEYASKYNGQVKKDYDSYLKAYNGGLFKR